MGLEFRGRHHRGIDDSRNLARLAHHLMGEGESFDATGHLSIRRHPPLDVEIRLANGGASRSVSGVLRRRSVPALLALASRELDLVAADPRLPDGRPVTQEGLLDAVSHTTVTVTAIPEADGDV